MSNVPNLYLKWRLYRSLVGEYRSDAEIARAIFGEEEGPVRFSKLLYGDYGCRPEIAAEVIGLMNARIETFRKAQGLPVDGTTQLGAAELMAPVYDFAQQLVSVSGVADPDRLNEAHRELIAELVPAAPGPTPARLDIERFSVDRSFEGLVPSGGDGPIVFEPGRHLGRLAVAGFEGDPAATYAFVARDTETLGKPAWEHRWGETVLWFPSPLTPTRDGDMLYLMPEPQPIRPAPGRYIATVILTMDTKTIASLDPRGADAPPGALDEIETARFLTNTRRLSKRKSSPIAVVSNEYYVAAPAEA